MWDFDDTDIMTTIRDDRKAGGWYKRRHKKNGKTYKNFIAEPPKHNWSGAERLEELWLERYYGMYKDIEIEVDGELQTFKEIEYRTLGLNSKNHYAAKKQIHFHGVKDTNHYSYSLTRKTTYKPPRKDRWSNSGCNFNKLESPWYFNECLFYGTKFTKKMHLHCQDDDLVLS